MPGGLSSYLHFFHDASNKLVIVELSGAEYAYVHNLQGDIVAILDSNGTKVVQYKYDAWGRPIGKTGSMAGTLGTVQPFRYRGYVYDEETGLYYLRSRYYNAQYSHFVNADSVLADVTQIGALNIFTYCYNSVTSYADTNGHNPIALPSLIGSTEALLAALNYMVAAIAGLLLGGVISDSAEKTITEPDPKATPSPSPSPAPTPRPAPTAGPTNVPTPAPAVYYLAYTIDNGAPIHFGAPMTLSQARYLIVSEKIVSVIRQEIGGKGAKLPAWGIWTLKQSDAERLADKLGNTGIHYEKDNIYHLPHYHCMVNENVHIWFAR